MVVTHSIFIKMMTYNTRKNSGMVKVGNWPYNKILDFFEVDFAPKVIVIFLPSFLLLTFLRVFQYILGGISDGIRSLS